MPRLHQAGIKEMPHPESVASRLLIGHMFNCGEQWMMACKAWLFERDIVMLNKVVISDDAANGADAEVGTASEQAQTSITPSEFETLRALLLAPEPPAELQTAQTLSRVTYNSTLPSILREPHPRRQKLLGRKARNFHAETWDAAASIPIVAAACIARAEVDDHLRDIYLRSGARTIVEGSPRDRVWGVGIMWNDGRIKDEANWKGENRLGVCHGLARAAIVGDRVG